ncbi:cytochrome c biogenesis protein CcsA [Chloroflexota bacterium]
MKSRTLLFASAVLMMASSYMVFSYVPTDKETGIVQRIFYFHVPLAWIAFFAFFLVFLGSIQYLRKRNKKWDIFASSSAEIGIIFTTLVLITGSIWARPVWGVWWKWDARLTTFLVLWFIYIVYFTIRAYISEEERRARFAAIVGIIGFIDVPIVALAISLSRTQHPGPIIFQGGLAPTMVFTLVICIFAFTMLYFLLFTERMSMKRDEDEVKTLGEFSQGVM